MPERFDLKRLQVRLPQSELRGRGSLTMADQQMQFHLDIPRLHLDELPISLPRICHGRYKGQSPPPAA